MKKSAVMLLASAAVLAQAAQADITWSGFGSFYAGKVISSGNNCPSYLGISGDCFLSDYPNVALYDDEWSFEQDTILGLQVRASVTDKLSVTGQLVGRGTDNFEAKMEWAYFSYELSPNWTLQGGRKRIPLFYYSDFFDVGYAYLWVRPPADTYTWQIFNYNGVNALYQNSFGDVSVSGNVYFGRENSSNNKLMSDFFFQAPVDENWKNIVGIVASAQWQWLEIRLSHMQTTRDRFVTDTSTGVREQTRDNQDMSMTGISVNLTPGNFILLTEYQVNDLDAFMSGTDMIPSSEITSQLISLGYRIGDVTPYVVAAEFDDGESEMHDTLGIGLRWDFASSVAFKIQYDRVKDEGNPPVAGDSKAITAGLDVVF